MKITTLVASIVTLALVGCGDDGDTLSQDQANLAFASTSQAMLSVESAAATASSSGVQVTASAACSGGGSASLEGTYDGQDSFNLDVAFVGCTEANITIDGSLEYGATVSDNGLSVIMSGDLSYSGSVEGSCEIDVTTVISDSEVSVNGRICGQRITASISDR